jgi:hypothetical protein
MDNFLLYWLVDSFDSPVRVRPLQTSFVLHSLVLGPILPPSAPKTGPTQRNVLLYLCCVAKKRTKAKVFSFTVPPRINSSKFKNFEVQSSKITPLKWTTKTNKKRGMRIIISAFPIALLL